MAKTNAQLAEELHALVVRAVKTDLIKLPVKNYSAHAIAELLFCAQDATKPRLIRAVNALTDALEGAS